MASDATTAAARPSILSFKPAHDGAAAVIADGRLLASMEAEHDAAPRHALLQPSTIVNACARLRGVPDILAVSGWVRPAYGGEQPYEGGYDAHDRSATVVKDIDFLGRRIRYFSSSHARSHILGAYGMSPFPQGQRVYVLVWEGRIGDFYEVDENVEVTHIGKVVDRPGERYSFLFALADPSADGDFRFEHAGKLMALALSDGDAGMDEGEAELTAAILDGPLPGAAVKGRLAGSRFYNIGLETPEFRRFAGTFSQRLFARYRDFALRHLTRKQPLLISGGCGLNCGWNTMWRESGLFSEVFVPPCTNDSGSAIGTAIDAQHHFSGNAKIDWDVYAGEVFRDGPVPDTFEAHDLDPAMVARALADGAVIAWVQGRCEIGPRALGNRSLLAAPFRRDMLDRLNAIKQREPYRPIAPVVLEEDAGLHFAGAHPSPHMLYFFKVRSPELAAVTHDDGSARPQTVNAAQNPPLYRLLRAFKARTGFGVLCNTSLNFKGTGFLNNMSDLVAYVEGRGLDGFVVGDRFWRRRPRA